MGQEESREWERDKGGNEVTALTAVDKEPLLGSRIDWGGAAFGVGTCSHRGKGLGGVDIARSHPHSPWLWGSRIYVVCNSKSSHQMVYRPQKEPGPREAVEATRRGRLSQKLLWMGERGDNHPKSGATR